MAEGRRYREDEVAEIFESAAAPRRAGGSAAGSDDGLTLAELQAIGREVGVAPERIAEAASALDVRGRVLPRRTFLGVPISVGRAVDLPRAPTDHEWEMLVAELRTTFDARGRAESRGSVREWRNGNLHACVEPTEAGYRLRLATSKGNAMPVTAIGASMIGMALVQLASGLGPGLTGGFGPGLTGELVSSLYVGGMGVAALVFNALRLPKWAGERERQMESVAARAQALITGEPHA